MPAFVMPKGNAPTEFDACYPFMRGYIEAMFFTDTGTGDDEELEDATFSDLAPETVARIAIDCDHFTAENAALLDQAYGRDYDEEQAGRDYWFTRNGHGVGYWDRDELEADGLGEKLSAACRHHSVDLYRGDDGRVYLA